MLFDAKCPYCGTWNRKLYLEETGGMMECQCCERISRNDYEHLCKERVRSSRSYHEGRTVYMTVRDAG